MQVEEGNKCGENRDCGGEHERLQAQNVHLNAVITRLTTEKTLLDDDYKRVKKKNLELLQDIESLKRRLGGINDAMLKISKQIAEPLNSGGLARTRPRILLKQVFDTHNGTPFIHMEAPFRSDRSGCFPHAIAMDTHTKKKELQLEHRRSVSFTFAVSFEDGSPATEYDIAEDGLVPFRMQFLYADDLSEVKAADFHKSDSETLTFPKQCEIAMQQMVKGMLSFHIKRFNVSSSECGRRRPILVKVNPVSEDLASDNDLCYRTEPFIIRARITVKKDKA
tara:strand:- start:2248 stop:3084 length:837 start_codon:yes stop_codon:yes gene_type:complete